MLLVVLPFDHWYMYWLFAGTLSVTDVSLQMGISALQVISQGSGLCAFVKSEHDKAARISKVFMVMVFFIRLEIICKNRKNPLMNAKRSRILFPFFVVNDEIFPKFAAKLKNKQNQIK